MRKRLIAVCSALVLAICLLICGCGDQAVATLEDIAADNSEIAKTINDEIEVPKGMNVEVEFSGDSFDITYSFKDKRSDADEKVLVKAFDSNAKTLKKTWESAISDLESQTGITGIVGTIIIKNASGEEIWTASYPERD